MGTSAGVPRRPLKRALSVRKVTDHLTPALTGTLRLIWLAHPDGSCFLSKGVARGTGVVFHRDLITTGCSPDEKYKSMNKKNKKCTAPGPQHRDGVSLPALPMTPGPYCRDGSAHQLSI